MARGWESKGVEAQQDEAARKKTVRPPMSEQDRLKLDHRRTLELTRARATAELIRATAPPHRRMLEEAIRAIDDKLARL